MNKGIDVCLGKEANSFEQNCLRMTKPFVNVGKDPRNIAKIVDKIEERRRFKIINWDASRVPEIFAGVWGFEVPSYHFGNARGEFLYKRDDGIFSFRIVQLEREDKESFLRGRDVDIR